jgi:hypothetical protein
VHGAHLPLVELQAVPMTIYFDGHHLATDGTPEILHRFAQRFGLKPEWYQSEARVAHYDVLSRSVRRMVVNHGVNVAAELGVDFALVSTRDILRACRVPST